MAKMNLDREYADGTHSYGPGEGVEVPDEVAKKIRALRKELKEQEDDGQE